MYNYALRMKASLIYVPCGSLTHSKRSTRRTVSDLTHRSVLHYANASSIVIFIQFKLHVARLLKDTQIPPAVVAIHRFRTIEFSSVLSSWYDYPQTMTWSNIEVNESNDQIYNKFLLWYKLLIIRDMNCCLNYFFTGLFDVKREKC